ncbi:MAG: hypothetical protein FWE53_04840 [Firmicutes bacterium]|nr:hypothetical protein [Bacillota bacterium]
MPLFGRKREYSDLSTTDKRVVGKSTGSGGKPAKTRSARSNKWINIAVIGLMTLGILIYGAVSFIQFLNDPFDEFGLSVNEIREIMSELNKPVNEAALLAGATPPTAGDFAALRTKIDTGFNPKMPEFGFWTPEGVLFLDNLLPPNGSKNDTPIEAGQQDVAAFLNYILNIGFLSGEGYTSFLNMLEIKGEVLKASFAEQDGKLALDFLVKLDMTQFKTALAGTLSFLGFFGINVPDFIYLSSMIELNIDSADNYSVSNAGLTINQLGADANNKTVTALCKLIFAEDFEDSTEAAMSFAGTVTEALTSLAEGWGASFGFSGNALHITKKA